MSQLPCTCAAGVMSVTVHTGPKTEVFNMPCLNCDGKGWRTPAEQRKVEAMNAMWCRCATPGEPVFHDDEPGSKHHWTCGTCGKVTQVG